MTGNLGQDSENRPAPPVSAGFTSKAESSTGVVSAAPGAAQLHLKKILVPTDFSEQSAKALAYAIPFSRQFGAELTLLHVLEPIAYPADLGYAAFEVPLEAEMSIRKDVQARLEEMAHRASTDQAQVVPLLRQGRPYDMITTTARELGTDLIIIATHGYTGIKHVFLGSTTERVVRHAPCPVLVVREREHEFIQ